MAAASLPSLVFCALTFVLWLHGHWGKSPLVVNLSPGNSWDRVFALELSIWGWVGRWNSVITLAATAFFVAALLRPRWRHFAALALIPYGLLLCADFTLRWL
jgi:hypothetical protein